MTDEEKKEKYELKFTNRFKKHLKLVEKRNPRLPQDRVFVQRMQKDVHFAA